MILTSMPFFFLVEIYRVVGHIIIVNPIDNSQSLNYSYQHLSDSDITYSILSNISPDFPQYVLELWEDFTIDVGKLIVDALLTLVCRKFLPWAKFLYAPITHYFL
jgi:hypothetical protein